MKRALGVFIAATVAVFVMADGARASESANLFRAAQDHPGSGPVKATTKNGIDAPCGTHRNGMTRAELERGWAYLDAGSTQTLREDGTVVRRLRNPPRQYVDIVADLADDFDLDPRLVISVMAVESGFHSRAVSPKGAQGLMQLIPATAARFGVADPFDPRQNIAGGMKYLRWLLNYFPGNLPFALAAYNAGEQAVMAHGGIPPYQETRTYVQRVLWLYDGIVAFGARGNGHLSLWSPAPWMKTVDGGDNSANC